MHAEWPESSAVSAHGQRKQTFWMCADRMGDRACFPDQCNCQSTPIPGLHCAFKSAARCGIWLGSRVFLLHVGYTSIAPSSLHHCLHTTCPCCKQRDSLCASSLPVPGHPARNDLLLVSCAGLLVILWSRSVPTWQRGSRR